jgi:hypothetical protein
MLGVTAATPSTTRAIGDDSEEKRHLGGYGRRRQESNAHFGGSDAVGDPQVQHGIRNAARP